MRETIILTFCFLALFTPNTFAECAWVLWKSTHFINLGAFKLALMGRDISTEEINVKRWKYLDGFQKKEECQTSRSERLSKFFSAQQVFLEEKKINEAKANEAASKNLQLPLEKRYPAFETQIAIQRLLDKDEKEIEANIYQQNEKKKAADAKREVRLSEDEAVLVGGRTFEFKCIPDTIDPRIKR